MSCARAAVLALGLAAAAIGVGCSSHDGGTGPSATTQLVFAIGPTQTITGRVINSGRVDFFGTFPAAVQVAIADASGKTVTSGTEMVTIALGPSSPGGAALTGTLTVQAVGGLATFADLKISQLGTGYTLVATSGTLTAATSDAFDVAVPMPVATLVHVGRIQACAMTGSGPYCWGHDGGGELGINDSIARLTPYPVMHTASALTQLTAGTDETCALTGAGAAFCWGHNDHGGVGDGTTAHNRFAPTAVSGGHGFSQISDGAASACAVTPSSAIYCWGQNDFGQVGNGATTDQLTPDSVHAAPTFAFVSVGWGFACALDASGAPWCWGSNLNGNLGDGTLTDRTTPVAVTGGPYVFATITTGDHQTCALRTSDGAAFCWGSNSNGQLGDGTTTDKSAPVAVSGGKLFSAISAGSLHTCGIEKGTGHGFCWGSNTFGELGDGTTTDRSAPTAVSGSRVYSSLSGGDIQTCGVESGTGAVYCWGSNNEGGLGDGTTNSSNVPVAVTP